MKILVDKEIDKNLRRHTDRKMKILKIILLCIISLFAIILPLNCEPTFMNSYPYKDLFPPTVWAYNSYCCNVIPALGGGFLLEVHMEPVGI